MAHEGNISPELDELSCELLGEALDLLAVGENVNVLLVVQDAAGAVAPFEFADDGAEECLEGAYAKVKELASAKGDPKAGLGKPIRYAICYEGAVADDESGCFLDAVILEFGEKGTPTFSAFSLYEGKGAGDAFAWTDPAPAGEVPSLL